MSSLIVAALLFVVPLATSSGGAQTEIAFERPRGAAGTFELGTRQVTLEDGAVVEVEAGSLLVPERRDRDTEQVISIPFYRVRCSAEAPGAPIFLLAGGPGSSWLDLFEDVEHFEEVRSYAQIADVILFDQRGAGRSQPALECSQQDQLPTGEPFNVNQWAAKMQAMSSACREHWTQLGVDLDAYTTVESAADVDDLRQAFGYERISLIGGSYGSHLALALMKLYPRSLHRVVMYGVEGLDQTWDDPTARLATYRRIAASAEASAELGPHIPEGGLIGALAEVIERLEREPAIASARRGMGSVEVVIDAELIRLVAGRGAGRRSRPNAWPAFILDLYEGDYSFVARGALALRKLRLDRPMHYMMDCSSGISDPRRKRFESDPARALIGDINLEYARICPAWSAPDLGDDFRSPVESATSTLIVHGTWDTSTPIENAYEVAATLENVHLVVMEGGGHGALFDFYRHWPPARDAVASFLHGEDVRFPAHVTLPDVEYRPRANKQ